MDTLDKIWAYKFDIIDEGGHVSHGQTFDGKPPSEHFQARVYLVSTPEREMAYELLAALKACAKACRELEDSAGYGLTIKPEILKKMSQAASLAQRALKRLEAMGNG